MFSDITEFDELCHFRLANSLYSGGIGCQYCYQRGLLRVSSDLIGSYVSTSRCICGFVWGGGLIGVGWGLFGVRKKGLLSRLGPDLGLNTDLGYHRESCVGIC
jgi:hypothetical protein